MSASPESIPLNAGDKLFLIPETDDLNGIHFPMSVIVGVPLKTAITREQVIKALTDVNQRFPQLRLAYRLDPTKDRLVRTPDADLGDYFDSLVHRCAFEDKPLEEVLSGLLSVNNTPISQPILIALPGHHLVIRMHHSFGDGKFVIQLMAYLLMAMLAPNAFEKLPDLALNYGLQMWRIVYQSPRQALYLLGKWVKTLRGSVQEYQRDVSATPSALEPVHTGTAMAVRLKALSAETMAGLDRLKKKLSGEEKISLNTLMQVLLAKRVCELGFSKPPVIYSVPVDLHRYMKQPDVFYPGNLISQIRVTGHAPFDLQAEVINLQHRVREQLDDMTAMATLPSEWLLMSAGRKLYKSINRGWLNASINGDPRFFVLSNLGSIDDQFETLKDHIDLSAGIATLAPLMGGPHLVVGLNILGGQCNLSFTYDPRVLSPTDIDAIFEGFTHELAD